MTTQADALFELGRQTLRSLIGELAARQVYVDPGLELRRGKGLLCYYSLQDGHIYLSVPDAEQPRGKFELFFFRSVVDLNSSDEIMRLLELLIPWLIAHEVGHHLRHRHGFLDCGGWEEERIANRLAGAFIKRRLTRDQKKELRDTLARAMANLFNGLRSQGNMEEVYPAQDPICYVYYHMRWFYLDLMAREEHTIDEFVRDYLGQSR
jgi:hypothetical protein